MWSATDPGVPIIRAAMTSTVKLNVGCGKNVVQGWINIDKSPSVLLSATPWLRKLLLASAVLTPEQAEGFPQGVVHANVVKRIPAADESADFIYSSHMIEHLSRWEALSFVRECHRVLRRSGALRLATPDLAVMVNDYLNGTSPFAGAVSTPADAFCLEYRAYANSQVNPVRGLVRKLMGGDSHQWLYDSASISQLLREGGFNEITACSYQRGLTPDLASVERRERSLFVEARAA
jgi:predicted SAM-dependent methyltransferase